MSAQLLDGKILAAKLKNVLHGQVLELKKAKGKSPTLVNILVGEDPGAHSYASSQKKTADSLSIEYRLEILKDKTDENAVSQLIQKFNIDKNIHGIILSKPLPKFYDYAKLANSIASEKDVEGLNPLNLGRLFLNKTKILPCTAASVIEHLRSIQIPLAGKEAVIVGRSEIVGKPLIFLLLQENVTVTVCHSGTSQAGKLNEHLKRADIVIAAMGKPKFILGDMIKLGAIVIDVGINEVNGKIVGDVDFEGVSKKASYITPVPGGVGPVTSVILMRNLIELFKAQK